MAKKDLRESLFTAHLNDLQDVISGADGFIICPICLVEFEKSAIDNGELTDGHIWPQEIREITGGDLATSHRVLLCRDCNSKAGGRGDAQMQILQRVRDGEKTGQLYGERRVQILIRGEKPTILQAKIINTGDKSGKLVFDIDPITQRWLRNNPAAQKRFETLGPEDRFSTVIHPSHELKSHLARAGWATSAYLLAFYSLGYRYTLSSFLDPVREYIKSSFEEGAKKHLKFQESVDFRVDICRTHHIEDPLLELITPLDGETPVHLQVSLLDHHVRLPFPCDGVVLNALMILEIPDVESRLQEAARQDAYLSTPIVCTKTDEHECVWDYVLGKEIPSDI